MMYSLPTVHIMSISSIHIYLLQFCAVISVIRKPQDQHTRTMASVTITFFSLLIIHTFLVSNAQAFLSAAVLSIDTKRRPYFSSSLSTKDANDEQGESNINSSMSSADKTARDVVVTCMDGLANNDNPWENAGLELCWDYSSDRNRAAQGGSFEEFISYASNPTFSSMVNAKGYSVENVGTLIPGSMTRGPMQTVLIKVQSCKGEERSYLW
jgi:hypothetical protein